MFSRRRLESVLSIVILVVAFGHQASAECNPCVVTSVEGIAAATAAACTTITLSSVAAPSNVSIELGDLPRGTTIVFRGHTTFGFTNSSAFTPLVIRDSADVFVTAEPDAVIDGGGDRYWDGRGSNGGNPKPNQFLELRNLTGASLVTGLRVVNWPVHGLLIVGCKGLVVRDVVLDNRAGDVPNKRSSGRPAGHNTDGIGVASSKGLVVSGVQVWNQDDCVAVTSGSDMTLRDLFCSGSHGLSVGSVGGKGDNDVADILFLNATLVNSQNGLRIKTTFNATGRLANVTYRDVVMVNTTTRGIVLQQDYLNGGPTGTPTAGVQVHGVLFENVTGTVADGGTPYYVLCGDGSCDGVMFSGVNITGGRAPSRCNYPPEGCPDGGVSRTLEEVGVW